MSLIIKVGEIEMWDSKKEEFSYKSAVKLVLEHSLLSISKWESKWHKPFLDKNTKLTNEQLLDYIRCMTINKNAVDDIYYSQLTLKDLKKIHEYIENPMTATWFNNNLLPKGHNREAVTSELIYYWMITLNIPFDCEKWHINRLFTLIQICNVKQQKPKKMSKRDLLQRNAALNQARRAKSGSKG